MLITCNCDCFGCYQGNHTVYASPCCYMCGIYILQFYNANFFGNAVQKLFFINIILFYVIITSYAHTLSDTGLFKTSNISQSSYIISLHRRIPPYLQSAFLAGCSICAAVSSSFLYFSFSNEFSRHILS